MVSKANPIRHSADLYIQASVQPEGAGPRITLVRHQGPGSIELDGLILEAQFACGDQYIVFTTEDVPFEESLHIHLLDAQLQVLDHLELSAWYSPGLLGHLVVAGPNAITFAFFDPEEVWTLTVFEAACWWPWFASHPVKRRASFWRRRRLRLQRLRG